MTVIPNAKIRGSISAAIRQIDVLVDYRYDADRKRRIIVDAKRRRRKIDVKQVEEFEGMMSDVIATHGVLICPSGYTKAAERRAQDAITIRLLGLEEVAKFDPSSWDPCKNENCGDGLLMWDTTPGITISNCPWIIHAIAKCDTCHQFNIWCWNCGEKFALSDEAEYQCNCKAPWFWLTAIEEDSSGSTKSVYLLLIVLGQVFLVDRRPLR